MFNVPLRSDVCFNPHPAREPGATHTVTSLGDFNIRVSILTRPVSRVQQWDGYVADQGGRRVSILTRPVSRVQRFVDRGNGFWHFDVSILTRPVSRVQPSGSLPAS